ncbi:MAG: hypothetical protein H6818_08425 [Phycisphaerales bacterium]|nr:hypothetical protein [Phycisphaerales bacterium]MCB9862595.1 hypothetical protein [Phycisphaerales bacterium]
MPQERRLFVGTRILVIVYVIQGLVVGFLTLRSSEPEEIGRAMGALAVWLFVWILGLIAWRLFQRSNLAYNLTVIFGVIFYLCSGIAMKVIEVSSRKNRVNQSLAQFQTNTANIRKQAIESLSTGTPDRELAANYTKLLDKLAQDAPGEIGVIAETISGATKRFVDLVVARDSAFQQFKDAGGLGTTNTTSIQSLDERLQLIDAVITRQDAVKSFRFSHEIADRLAKRGATERVISSVLQEAKSNPAYALQQEVTQADYDRFLIYREILSFLRTHRDKWSYAQPTNQFTIVGIERAAEYNQLAKLQREIEEERNQLLQRIADSSH